MFCECCGKPVREDEAVWNETWGYVCEDCDEEHPHDPATCPVCKGLPSVY